MDSIISTPRLRLTLLKSAEQGQPELDWLHELLSNKDTTWWSISGQSKSLEDTEQKVKKYLPTAIEGDAHQYRVAYLVHRYVPNTTGGTSSSLIDQSPSSTEFVGLVSIGPGVLELPEHLTLPKAIAATTLTVELAYQFLPKGWGLGYATEAVNAVFGACKQSPSFWLPHSKLYVRGLVNPGNPQSMRVMDKVGMEKKGVFAWTGKAVYLAGEWRERDNIVIYGKHLIESK